MTGKDLLRFCHHLNQLIGRRPEHAFDAGGIADAYLDMGSRVETGPFISRLTFHEYPAHGVYGLIFVIFANLM